MTLGPDPLFRSWLWNLDVFNESLEDRAHLLHRNPELNPGLHALDGLKNKIRVWIELTSSGSTVLVSYTTGAVFTTLHFLRKLKNRPNKLVLHNTRLERLAIDKNFNLLVLFASYEEKQCRECNSWSWDRGVESNRTSAPWENDRKRIRGCIFSHVRPSYERAVSDLDRSIHRSPRV